MSQLDCMKIWKGVWSELMENLLQWYGLAGLILGMGSLTFWLLNLNKRLNEVTAEKESLRKAWQDFQSDRKELFDALADPIVIEKQMEASANMKEYLETGVNPHVKDLEKPPATIHTPMPGTGTLKPGGLRRIED